MKPSQSQISQTSFAYRYSDLRSARPDSPITLVYLSYQQPCRRSEASYPRRTSLPVSTPRSHTFQSSAPISRTPSPHPHALTRHSPLAGSSRFPPPGTPVSHRRYPRYSKRTQSHFRTLRPSLGAAAIPPPGTLSCSESPYRRSTAFIAAQYLFAILTRYPSTPSITRCLPQPPNPSTCPPPPPRQPTRDTQTNPVPLPDIPLSPPPAKSWPHSSGRSPPGPPKRETVRTC